MFKLNTKLLHLDGDAYIEEYKNNLVNLNLAKKMLDKGVQAMNAYELAGIMLINEDADPTHNIKAIYEYLEKSKIDKIKRYKLIIAIDEVLRG